MAKSYRSRLNGRTAEFIEDVGKYGVWGAMDKYGFKDYLSVRKIIMEETGDEHYGFSPKLAVYRDGGIRSVLREVVAAFADYVIRNESEKRILRRQLEAYRDNFNNEETDFADELLGVAQALKD